jgi:HK97 family phage portal protein
MTFASRLRTAFSVLLAGEAKASAVAGVMHAGHVGARWTDHAYDRLADEAYVLNPIAYRCIALKAGALASLQLVLKDGDRELPTGHPVATLLARPNPMQGGAALLEALASYYDISGNAWLERVPRAGRAGGGVLELHSHRPDRITVHPGPRGWPEFYRYEVGGRYRDFRVDQATGRCDLLHLRRFHPLDDQLGLAPTVPGARAIDQHSAAAIHNASLLQGGVTPSGLLTPAGDNQVIGEEEIRRIRERIAQKPKAGGLLMLGSRMIFTSLGLTNKDMDFLNLDLAKAREICGVYGVPPVLVVAGESTYANREAGWRELYEGTVLPQFARMMGDVAPWLGEAMGVPNLRIEPNRDEIPALATAREAHRKAVVEEFKEGLVTLDEAREALQYPKAKDKGDGYRVTVTVPGEEPPPTTLLPPGRRLPAPKSEEAEAEVVVRGGYGAPERKADDLDLDGIAGSFDDGEMAEEVRPLVRDAIRSMGQRLLDELRLGFAFDVTNPAVVEFLERYGAERVTLIGDTTRDRVRRELADGVRAGEATDSLTARIRRVFADANGYRANLISETELTLATGFGTQQALEQAQVPFKEFLATPDSRTRDTHRGLNGQVRPVDEPYQSPDGDRGLAPGLFGKAANNIRCRCVSVASLSGAKADSTPEQAARWALWDNARRGHEAMLADTFRQAFAVQERQVVAALTRRAGVG